MHQEYTVIEYTEPVSPANRRVWDFGAGPLVFEATDAEAAEFRAKLPWDGPLRLVPVEYARKAGLLRD